MLRDKNKTLMRLRRSSSGFTLVEVLVAISLLTVVLGMFGGSVFQVLSIQRFWRDDVIATKEIRHAESSFAGDAFNAASVDLAGCGAPPCVTLAWTDNSGVPRQAIYALSGDDLIRQFVVATTTVSQRPVARNVVSAGFSLSGKVLTFSLEAKASRDRTATSTLQTFLRKLN